VHAFLFENLIWLDYSGNMRKLEVEIKLYLTELGCFELVQDRVRWLALVDMRMKYWVT
jgi:hypothetical protein